jgi:hypothetical protein
VAVLARWCDAVPRGSPETRVPSARLKRGLAGWYNGSVVDKAGDWS